MMDGRSSMGIRGDIEGNFVARYGESVDAVRQGLNQWVLSVEYGRGMPSVANGY